MSETSSSTTPHPYQPNVRRRGAGPGTGADEAELDAVSQQVSELNRRYPALRRNVEVVQPGPSNPRPPPDRISRPHALQPWCPQTGETIPQPLARGADPTPILRNEARPFARQAMPRLPPGVIDLSDRPPQNPMPVPRQIVTRLPSGEIRIREERFFEPTAPPRGIVLEPPRGLVDLVAAPNAGRLPNTVARQVAPQFARGVGRPQGHPLNVGSPAEDWAARAPATTTAPPPLERASKRRQGRGS